ncbi:HER095Wp [Eremothecium sinecaudum]|uniref:Signal recognition particle subunit SRP72 n=1 Tax=Eremothecium sinecaudum TaxID=45286 RepID=A0A0X8HTV2_9SACH|nr:HER095Wp [Eremothecium sinecaudum]AMD21374.1 HER095Wp [Eremothecium sinecaudum]
MTNKDLCSLLKDLDVYSENNEQSKISNACLKLLNMGCSNAEDVLKKCIIALVKQDQYQNIPKLFEQYSEFANDVEKFGLLKLYTYYRSNSVELFEKLWHELVPNTEELLQNDSFTGSDRALLHVRAQFCYKTRNYRESLAIYQALSRTNQDQYDSGFELACNELAALSVLSDVPVSSGIDVPSYELLLNEAIAHSLANNLDEALQVLERASGLASAEGDESNLQLIMLQIAYVKQRLGQNKESKRILLKLLTEVPSSSSLVPIIKTNLKSMEELSKYDSKCNLPLVLRELDVKRITSMNAEKYSPYQWDQLQSNIILLKLFSNASIKSKSNMLSQAISKYSTLIDNVALEPYKVQAKRLFRFMVKTIAGNSLNNKTFGLLLISMQLQLKVKNLNSAIILGEQYWNKLIESSTMNQQARVISYILLSMYEIGYRSHSTQLHLDRVVETFSIEAAGEVYEFWKFIGFTLLGHRRLEDAKKIFSALINVQPSDRLVRIVANDDDFAIAFEDSSNIEDLVADVDVEDLIKKGCTPFITNQKSVKASLNKVTKKKRVSKNKLPQNFDPNRTPDPERWLPLKDRTNYKQKKKLTKITQGGAMNKKIEQSLDITKQKKGKGKKA